jgi:hypothetical protein
MVANKGDGRRAQALLVLVLLLAAVARPAAALDLSATRWEAVARRHALDPLLLYALALHETHRPSGDGMATPWPWTLGTPEGRRFYDSREAARAALDTFTEHGRDIAVGLLQVSLKHHGHRVGDPATLLDPGINLVVAAGVLADALGAAPGDPALGVGGYRYPDDERAARRFGRGVLALREALRGRARTAQAHPVVDLWRTSAVLDLVAGPESRGNYNAWYRSAHQQEVALAALTVSEVRALQRRLVRRSGGSAIGRYQIIGATLDGLIARLGLTGNERFTPALQDRMAMQLAHEAGLEAWLAGALDDERFAANLARVWAGLPSDQQGRSFYDGIQGNRATIGWRTLVASLRDIRANGVENDE